MGYVSATAMARRRRAARLAVRCCVADSPDPVGVVDVIVTSFPGGRCVSPGLSRPARSGREATKDE